DAVIGNSDRHQDNWSVIVSPSGARRLAPSYDHGSSLGSHIAEEQIEAYVGSGSLAHYVSRGRSRIGWREGMVVRQLRHPELVRRLATKYPGAVQDAVKKVYAARRHDIESVVEDLPDVFATGRRKVLMCDILRRRIGLLKDAYASK